MAEAHETQPADLSYIDDMELRHTLLKELQTTRLWKLFASSRSASCMRREFITEAVWAAFWVTPIKEIQRFIRETKQGRMTAESVHCVLSSLQSDVPRLIKSVLGKNQGNASAAACKELEWPSLGLLWGPGLVDDFKSALSVDTLNSPVNIITLDSNVRYLWAKAKLSFEPHAWDDRSIRLRLRFLKDSKLAKTRHGQGRFPWRNDLAMKPTEVVVEGLGDYAEDEMVYEGTQRPIRDGDFLIYRLDDPACRLDPRLLCFWHKIYVMASLVGYGERNEQACLEFAQGLADTVEEGEVEENERREEIVRVWKEETARARGVYETEEGEDRMGASG